MSGTVDKGHVANQTASIKNNHDSWHKRESRKHQQGKWQPAEICMIHFWSYSSHWHVSQRRHKSRCGCNYAEQVEKQSTCSQYPRHLVHCSRAMCRDALPVGAHTAALFVLLLWKLEANKTAAVSNNFYGCIWGSYVFLRLLLLVDLGVCIAQLDCNISWDGQRGTDTTPWWFVQTSPTPGTPRVHYCTRMPSIQVVASHALSPPWTWRSSCRKGLSRPHRAQQVHLKVDTSGPWLFTPAIHFQVAVDFPCATWPIVPTLPIGTPKNAMT